MQLSGQWIDQVHQRKPLKELILDLDSSVSETYGRQQGTPYNGYFECLCYHPLFLFNQFGDLESILLRRGNKASAKYWRRALLPVSARYRHLTIPKFFRGDAAFADPALYSLLEKVGYRYAIRLKANAVLEREIEHLLTRPVGRPSHQPKVFYHTNIKPNRGRKHTTRRGQDRMARGRVVSRSWRSRPRFLCAECLSRNMTATKKGWSQGEGLRGARVEGCKPAVSGLNSRVRNEGLRIGTEKTMKIHSALDTGGRDVKWRAFRAWIGSRLNPNGKCRIVQL